MDQIRLENFLMVCKEKSFTRAADKLFVTPAAVKKQIDALENEIGVPLFYRTNAGCTLTDAGVYFKGQAEKILKLINQSIEKTKDTARSAVQEIRIGHSVRLEYGFASGLSDLFNEHNPDHYLHFARMKKSDLETALLNHEIDAFLYINPQKKDFAYLNSVLTGTSAVHAVMRKKHPLSEKEKILREDLEGYEIFVSAVLSNSLFEELQNLYGPKVHILDTAGREELMYHFVRNSITLYPCYVSHDRAIPFEEDKLNVVLYYDKSTALLKSFIQEITDYFKNSGNAAVM